MCVCAVYIYYAYTNTHTCMYIFKKYVMKYINIYAYKYFLNICECMYT